MRTGKKHEPVTVQAFMRIQNVERRQYIQGGSKQEKGD